MPNVPPLRFPEFSGEWEKFALSDFTERVTRRNKGNACRLPLTISAQYGLVDQITFFNKQIASADMSNYYLVKKGEFTYNKSYSGDYPWGAVKRLDRYDEGCLSSLYICFSLKPFVNSDFITHYFETTKWYRGVSEIAGEGARNHGLLNIAIPDYFATKHYLPANSEEQQKIADLFDLLTKRIETQIRVIEDLQTLKKAISTKVFTEIKGCNSEKLGTLCSITTGKLDANAMTDEGEYMFFTCSRENYKTDTFAFDGEALLIAGNGEIGSVKYYNGKFNAYQRTYVLQNFSENIKYLQYYIEHHLPQRVLKEKNVGAMPYIVLSTLADMPILLPSENKQNNIAKALQVIENKIYVEYSVLDQYKQQKQYLLQKMFI